MTTVYALHTGPVLVEVLRKLFPEILPGVRLVNIVDDGLLTDLRTAGGLTPSVVKRVIGYGLLAEGAGADAILSCCSSVGEASDMLAQAVNIPLVKIDDRMASEAITHGPRVGIMATVATTLDPTERMIRRKAVEAGKEVTTTRYLAGEAFDALIAGDAARHDELVRAEVERAMSENDVVVLAQGSMARLVPLLGGASATPVLSSPRLGVEALRERLNVSA